MNHHRPNHESVPITGWRLTCLILIATIWGMSELIGGETVQLVAIALVLLAVARAVVNRPGTSLGIAAVALLFKTVNTAPHPCHLAGIGLLGLSFDISATMLWRHDARRFIRAAATGLAAGLMSCFLFAASMVWVVQYKSWAGGGMERVLEYTLSSGSRGALTGLIVVPVGLWLGSRLTRQATGHPKAALAAAALVSLALWALGPFAG